MPLHLRDQKSMMNLTQFEATIWAKKAQFTMASEQMANYDFVLIVITPYKQMQPM